MSENIYSQSKLTVKPFNLLGLKASRIETVTVDDIHVMVVNHAPATCQSIDLGNGQHLICAPRLKGTGETEQLLTNLGNYTNGAEWPAPQNG